MEQTAPDPTPLQRWLLAIRPRTLPASASPVVAGWGVALYAGRFDLLPALAALVCALLLQIAANLTNDVADFTRGADTRARLGPLRVTQAGLLTPRQVWQGVAVTLALAALLGLYLALVGGLPVIIIGLAAIISVLLYSVGPYPLAYIGLGDLFVMIFFGLTAVCGTSYVVSGQVPPLAWLAGIGVGALTVNILVVNNIRDIASDRKAGRRNIPVIFGRRGGELEYAAMLALAYLIPPVMLITTRVSPLVLLALLSLPDALRLYKQVCSTEISPKFNLLLAKTAQLEMAYGALLALGMALTPWLP